MDVLSDMDKKLIDESSATKLHSLLVHMVLVALITGCSEGGIGNELAHDLARRGIRVYFSARKIASIGQIPQGCHAVELDVSVDESVKKAFSHIISEEGRLDILVNNAGVGCVGPLAELPLSDATSCFDINVIGTIRCIQAVSPIMVAQASGTIVNIGSVVGLIGTPWASVYCASKAAIHNLSDVLRHEMRPFGVKVICIAPGAIRSNIGANNEARLDVSHYKIFARYAGLIQARANLSQSNKSTPTDVFARTVADQILKKNPPSRFAFGHMSNLFIFLSQYCPSWLLTFLFQRLFFKKH